MQNNKQKFKEFSPPCVDNSTKNQEKSSQNQSLSSVTDKNDEKTPNFQENSGILPASAVDLPVEGVSDINSASNASKTDGFEQKASESQENAGENQENAGESKVILTYESQIERDFKDFSIIYPHISKEHLLSNESLRLFAEGKESKQLSVVYATYCKFANIIANDAILQEKSRISNAGSSSGSLSSSQGANKSYFTKEQVKAMSAEEIKQNYDLIRQSQRSW